MTKTSEIDLAAVAVQRANRTKFFEMVIPVVPFISHRNARDHLKGELKKVGLPDGFVSRPLLDLVARHTTDMRLLINICNEFAVFAEQLYWTANRAPKMTRDHLFALIAYKNFHLADFESIPQRASVLEALEASHRELVRATIEELQRKRRELIRTEERRRVQDEAAAELGKRLLLTKDLVSARLSYGYRAVEVGGETYSFEDALTPTFWRRVAEAKSLTLLPAQPQYENSPVALNAAQLAVLFPGSDDLAMWRDSSPAELARQVKQYDEDITSLRGADFKELARYEQIPASTTPFKQTVASTLGSELARDLVLRGFLTRNFAEYSARFYGSFIGVDVAFFYNHSVQPNQMYVDYRFTTDNAVPNLLEQVAPDFTSSASSLNIEVVSYLLEHDLVASREVAAFIVEDFSSDAQTFLDAFINSPSAPHESLVGLLAAHPWRELFHYVAAHPGMPDEDTRRRLLNVALLNATSVDAYDDDEAERALLAKEYAALPAFNTCQSPDRTEVLYRFIEAADIIIEDLNVIAEPLRARIVAGERYAISKPNLQCALAIDEVPTLDEVRKAEVVWNYVRHNIDMYLDAILVYQPDAEIVIAEAVLAGVVADQHGTWTDEQLARVIEVSALTAALTDITTVTSDAWSLVVAGRRAVPTIANVNAYASKNGVDQSLADYLVDGGNAVQLREIDDVDQDAKRALAVLILNAGTLPSASTRVALVAQFDLTVGVDVASLVPAGDHLFARALEAGLIPDEEATFLHFSSGGWASVAEAFVVSKNIQTFLTPTLVSEYVVELVRSKDVSEAIRSAVAKDVARFVPNDEVGPLQAIGLYAAEKRLPIPRDQVSRIARVTKDASAVLPHLVRDVDLSPDQLIETLVLLGAPYSALKSGTGVDFDLPPGSSAKTLMERLETAGRVEIFNRGRGAGKGVQNLE